MNQRPLTPLATPPVKVAKMVSDMTGGNFVTAKPVGVVDGIDYGFTGTVRKVINKGYKNR